MSKPRSRRHKGTKREKRTRQGRNKRRQSGGFLSGTRDKMKHWWHNFRGSTQDERGALAGQTPAPSAPAPSAPAPSAPSAPAMPAPAMPAPAMPARAPAMSADPRRVAAAKARDSLRKSGKRIRAAKQAAPTPMSTRRGNRNIMPVAPKQPTQGQGEIPAGFSFDGGGRKRRRTGKRQQSKKSRAGKRQQRTKSRAGKRQQRTKSRAGKGAKRS